MRLVLHDPDEVNTTSADTGPRPVRWRLLLAYLVLVAVLLYLLLLVIAPWLPEWFPDIPVVGLLGLSRRPWVTCESQPSTPDFVWSFLMIGFCVFSFWFGGRHVGYEPRPEDQRSRRLAWLYQALVVGLYWVIAMTLLYEAFGTWKTDLDPNDPNLPITWYVRCAIRNQTALTLLVTGTLCVLAGHWLQRRRSN